MDFQVNQIVKGKVTGHFVILGFRQISGETYAQVKRIDPRDQSAYPGEFALPVTALQAI